MTSEGFVLGNAPSSLLIFFPPFLRLSFLPPPSLILPSVKENGDVLMEGCFQIKGQIGQRGIKVSRPQLPRNTSVKGPLMSLRQIASLFKKNFFSCKRFWLHDLCIHSRAKFCGCKCIWHACTPLGAVFGVRIPGRKGQDEAVLFCEVCGLTSRNTILNFQRRHGWQARKHGVGPWRERV